VTIRTWLLLFILGGASLPSWASNAIVHMASFACQHCQKYEAYAPGLQATAERADIKYIFAPISLKTDSSYYPELAYYGARALSATAARKARAALFQGQVQGLPFEDSAQVVEWLRLKEPMESVVWESLPSEMEENTTRSALYRAYRLLSASGVTSVPAVIWVRNGVVAGSIQLEEGESLSKFNGRVTTLLSTIKE